VTRTSKRAIRPGFDDLEGRGLLSGLMVGGTNAAVIVQQPVTPPEQTPLTLSGTITGNYNSAFNIYQLIGNGPITITPPGGNPVTLSAEGSISLPTRFTLPGHGGGTLTLSDSQGTLTLQLTGPLFSDVPGVSARTSARLLFPARPVRPVRLRDHGGHRRLRKGHRSRDGLPSVGCRPESLGATRPLQLGPGGPLQPSTSARRALIEFDGVQHGPRD
jgi:hypothetical protein